MEGSAHVADTLYHEIVLKKGVPLLFHTDAAKAFLSVALKSLSDMLGIQQTSTLAHNPKSNAKMERVWEFVGRALRSLTTEQYAHFPQFLPILEHVWNGTPDSDTGVTPFEAEHGMPMRGVAESLVQNPPPEGLPAELNDIKKITASVHAFTELLSNVKRVEKAQAAIRLNERGFSRIEFNIGDRVTFFLPPTQRQAERMGKYPKHMLHYAGPGEIVEQLSPNKTSWRIRWNGRHYNRNVMHMIPYAPDAHVIEEQRAVQDNSVTVNSFVAVLDESEDTHYHVARVIDIDEHHTTLHYLGTGSRALRSAVWKFMYHSPDGNGLRYYRQEAITPEHERFTGTIDTRPIEDSLIILPNLGFTDRMRLTKDTRAILRNSPYEHHVFHPTGPPRGTWP